MRPSRDEWAIAGKIELISAKERFGTAKGIMKCNDSKYLPSLMLVNIAQVT
jgi:hypothetical protein